MNSSRCSGRRTSSVQDLLPRLTELYIECRLYGRSTRPSASGPYPPTSTESSIAGSGRGWRPRVVGGKTVGLSTRITSAPRSARCRVRSGPDQTVVRSRTRSPLQWWDIRVAGDCCRRSLRPLDGIRRELRLPERRGGVSKPPASFGVPVRGPRHENRPYLRVDTVDPEAALVEVVGRQQLLGLVDRRDRPPGRLPGFGDLLPGPAQQPRIENAVQDLFGLWTSEGVGTGEGFRQFGTVENRQHLFELLGRHHQRHVSVGARMDPVREQDRAAVECPRGLRPPGLDIPSRGEARSSSDWRRVPLSPRNQQRHPRPSPARGGSPPAHLRPRCDPLCTPRSTWASAPGRAGPGRATPRTPGRRSRTRHSPRRARWHQSL